MSTEGVQPIPLLPQSESLTVEFKSDRNRLHDDDLVEALACLANTQGGELWLGVEDDGTPTGLHETHQSLTGLPGLVAARTSPSLAVTVEAVEISGVRVARIVVPRFGSEVATTAGKYSHRRIKPDGQPECVPMLPHDRRSRANRFGLHDASAQPVAGATLADLDPLERERLRQTVQQYGGDRVLLELDDEALDGALGFTARTESGTRYRRSPACWSLAVNPRCASACRRTSSRFRCLSAKRCGSTSSGAFRS